MKASFYELFDSGAAHRAEAAENVKFKTLRRLEQTQAARRSVRPLRRVLIAAAVVIALVGGAFAAPAIVNALTGVSSRQAGRGVLQLTERGVLVRAGYLEITPEITKNEDAPETIETWFVPSLCADWEPVPQYYSSEAAPSMQKDASFAWKLPEGYALLRQFTLTGYAPDVCFDTVSLGFGSDYTLSEKQYGEIPVYCVAVPPSEYPEPVGLTDEQTFYSPGGYGGYSEEALRQYDLGSVCFDTDEEAGLARMYCRGLKRLYWSDGDYLFTLEVNYDMPDETLDAILSSLTPVEDFRPYVRMERMEPAPAAEEIVQTVLFPDFVPEGWTLMDGGSGTGGWIWSYADRSGLELLQETEPTSCDCERLDWLGSMEDCISYETTVGDWRVTVFESDFKAALLWKTETTYVVLRSSGPDRLGAEALLQIAASLQPLQ